MGDPHVFTTMPSPVGELTLVATEQGLRAVLWPGDDDRVPLPDTMQRDDDHPLLQAARDQIRQYFEGARTEFDLPLDLRGTEFQRARRPSSLLPRGPSRSLRRRESQSTRARW